MWVCVYIFLCIKVWQEVFWVQLSPNEVVEMIWLNISFVSDSVVILTYRLVSCVHLPTWYAQISFCFSVTSDCISQLRVSSLCWAHLIFAICPSLYWGSHVLCVLCEPVCQCIKTPGMTLYIHDHIIKNLISLVWVNMCLNYTRPAGKAACNWFCVGRRDSFVVKYRGKGGGGTARE